VSINASHDSSCHIPPPVPPSLCSPTGDVTTNRGRGVERSVQHEGFYVSFHPEISRQYTVTASAGNPPGEVTVTTDLRCDSDGPSSYVRSGLPPISSHGIGYAEPGATRLKGTYIHPDQPPGWSVIVTWDLVRVVEQCRDPGQVSHQVNTQSALTYTGRMSHAFHASWCVSEDGVLLLTAPETFGFVDPTLHGLIGSVFAEYAGLLPVFSWEYLGTDGGARHPDSTGPHAERYPDGSLTITARGRFQQCTSMGVPVVKGIVKGWPLFAKYVLPKLPHQVREPLEWASSLGEDVLETAIDQLPDSVKARLARAAFAGMLMNLALTDAEGKRLVDLLDLLVGQGMRLADEDQLAPGLQLHGLAVTYCEVLWQPEYTLRVPAGVGLPQLFAPDPYAPPGFETPTEGPRDLA
ncbi:MAG TPA: hypothetical protein VGW38_19700, partial [Chloroflexota bacterium]|nr:hypothetical protein [Chloroflexota bacterium]